MTYSLTVSPRYKGHGRPRKVDYKTIKDRHIEHIPTLLLAGLSIGLGIYFYSKNPQQLFAEPIELVSPLVQVQASELVTPTPAPEPEPAPGWEGFVSAAHKVSKIYNYPVNVVLAQGALESARGNSRYAKERNNYLGINAVDSNPDLAYTFENSEQCIVEYMRIIRKNFPAAWAQRENPEALLQALKVNSNGKMYATDPAYVSKVMSMKEWSIK